MVSARFPPAKVEDVVAPWKTSSPKVSGTEALHFMYLPGMEVSESRAYRKGPIERPLGKFSGRFFHVFLSITLMMVRLGLG